MLLNILPVHIEGLNCLESALFNVAIHLKQEYQIAFSNMFYFHYSPEDQAPPDLIGQRISPFYYDYKGVFEKYFGFTFEERSVDSKKQVYELITEQLQRGLPTALLLDVYHLQYHADFQKRHYDHCLLVVGSRDSGLTCIDSMGRKENIILSDEELAKGFKRIIILKETMQAQEIDYRDILSKSIANILSSSMFSELEKFVADFRENFDLDKELYNFERNELDAFIIVNLNHIAKHRELYAKFILYVSDKLNDPRLGEIHDDLLRVVKKWNLARAQIVRWYYNKKLNMKTVVADKLFEISVNEQKILQKIEEVVKFNDLPSQRAGDMDNDDDW